MEERKETTQKEGKLILCIECRDLGGQLEIAAATNGSTKDILMGWAHASAKLLADMKVPKTLAFMLLEAVAKHGEQGEQEEESND